MLPRRRGAGETQKEEEAAGGCDAWSRGGERLRCSGCSSGPEVLVTQRRPGAGVWDKWAARLLNGGTNGRRQQESACAWSPPWWRCLLMFIAARCPTTCGIGPCRAWSWMFVVVFWWWRLLLVQRLQGTKIVRNPKGYSASCLVHDLTPRHASGLLGTSICPSFILWNVEFFW